MIVEHPTLPNLLAPPQFTVAAREAFCRGRPKFQQMINLIGNVFDVELGGSLVHPSWPERRRRLLRKIAHAIQCLRQTDERRQVL